MDNGLLTSYSKVVSAGLRSIAAPIPYLASLGQAWSEYESHRTEQRIIELMENLRSEFEDLRDAPYKMPPGFPELLEITVEKVRKEFEESKRKTYAKLLARLSIAGDEHSHSEMVALIESLETLSDLDLRVLMAFDAQSEKAIKDLARSELGLMGADNQKIWQLTSHLVRLESRGLVAKVFTHTGVVHVDGVFDAYAGRQRETKYRILSLGASLVKRLRN